MRSRLISGLLSTLSMVGAGLFATGCAAGGDEGGTTAGLQAGHLVGFSQYNVRLGSTLEVYASELPRLDAGRALLVFNGKFVGENGTRDVKNLRVFVRRKDEQTLVLDKIGPFTHIWSDDIDNQVGTFQGTAALGLETNEQLGDGTYKTIVDAEATDVMFTVEPSVQIFMAQPRTARCAEPAKVWINKLPMAIGARVLGDSFTPVSFTFQLKMPRVAPDITKKVPAVGKEARVGDATDGSEDDFTLPELPPDFGIPSYAAVMLVTATDATGRSISTQFAVDVRQPFYVVPTGRSRVIQVYEPEVTSLCIPGTPNGSPIAYQEGTVVTRSRSFSSSLSDSFSQGWSSSTGFTAGEAFNNGVTFTNGFSNGTSLGTNWGISNGSTTGGGGEFGGNTELNLFGFLKLGGSGKDSWSDSVTSGNTNGGSFGSNNSFTNSTANSFGYSSNTSTTTTATDSVSNTASMGTSEGTADSTATSISKSYGTTAYENEAITFFRQEVVLGDDNDVIVYNQCGIPTNVGRVTINRTVWAPGATRTRGDQCGGIGGGSLTPPPPPTMLKAGCYGRDDECMPQTQRPTVQ